MRKLQRDSTVRKYDFEKTFEYCIEHKAIKEWDNISTKSLRNIMSYTDEWGTEFSCHKVEDGLAVLAEIGDLFVWKKQQCDPPLGAWKHWCRGECGKWACKEGDNNPPGRTRTFCGLVDAFIKEELKRVIATKRDKTLQGQRIRY